MVPSKALVVLVGWLLSSGCAPPASVSSAPAQWANPAMPRPDVESCFLLHPMATKEVVRGPDSLCATRVSPASTFKVPHALFALDAGVVDGSRSEIPWDGVSRPFEVWNRNHSLPSAMRYSVVWYFQRLAEQIGPSREKAYLRKIGYGNADTSSGLTTFWLGGSLRITPEEQLAFLDRLFTDDLPFSKTHMDAVRGFMVQAPGVVQRGPTEVPFAPGLADPKTVLRVKTGGADTGNEHVRWLLGHVQRGTRGWTFVAAVRSRHALSNEAIELAGQRLQDEGVWGASARQVSH